MKENRKVTGQLGIYLQWPLLLSTLIIIMNIIVGAIDTMAGLAMFGFTILYLALALFLYIYKRKGIMAGLVEFSSEYAWIQKKPPRTFTSHTPSQMRTVLFCGPTPSSPSW